MRISIVAVAILRSSQSPGTVKIKVKAAGLKLAEKTLKLK